MSWCTLQVALEEHRCSRRAWQVSQTLTGFGEAGRGSSLSEQLLQKISPQFRQWCWKKDQCWVLCSLIKRYWMFPMIRGPTFLLEMENSFSHSLHWLASLSFNQTWPPWNNHLTLSTCLNLLKQHQRHRRYATWRALLASLISSIFIFDLVRNIRCQVNECLIKNV